MIRAAHTAQHEWNIDSSSLAALPAPELQVQPRSPPSLHTKEPLSQTDVLKRTHSNHNHRHQQPSPQTSNTSRRSRNYWTGQSLPRATECHLREHTLTTKTADCKPQPRSYFCPLPTFPQLVSCESFLHFQTIEGKF